VARRDNSSVQLLAAFCYRSLQLSQILHVARRRCPLRPTPSGQVHSSPILAKWAILSPELPIVAASFPAPTGHSLMPSCASRLHPVFPSALRSAQQDVGAKHISSVSLLASPALVKASQQTATLKIVQSMMPRLSFPVLYQQQFRNGEHHAITEGKQTTIRALHDRGRWDALFFHQFVVGCCWGHDRVALHIALHAVSTKQDTKEEQISLSGCRSTRGSLSSNPQITAFLPRFSNESCFLNSGESMMLTLNLWKFAP